MRRVGIVLLGVAATLDGAAAQSPGTPTVGDAPGGATVELEDIVVTAQRRPETLNHVPISISVIDGRALVERASRSLTDLNGTVAGTYLSGDVNYQTAPIAVRGIGGSGTLFGDEPVAIYTDGIYLGRLTGSTTELLDVASIEVLRGPQGTLYGRNSTAGALLITSVRPGDRVEGYVRAAVADYGEHRVAAAASLPAGGDVTVRAAAALTERAGWARNRATGGRLASSEDASGRLTAVLRPTKALSVMVIGDYSRFESSPATLRISTLSDPQRPLPGAELDGILERNDFALDSPNTTVAKQGGIAVEAIYDLGPAALTSLTGWRRWRLRGAQDSDGTALPLLSNTGAFDQKQFSEELRLGGDLGRLAYLVGVYYYRERLEMRPFIINSFLAAGGQGLRLRFDSAQRTEAVAGFVDATWRAQSRLSLTAGLRYSRERKRFSNDRLTTVLATGTIAADPPPYQAARSWDGLSPRAVLTYRLTDRSIVYASYARGFKSGGFNGFGADPAFDPETNDSYELGVKGELLDRRVRFTLAGFHNDYRDLQVRRPVQPAGIVIANAAAAVTRGVELEATAAPMAGLRLTASASYLDARYRDYVTRDLDGLIVDASGARLSRAPEWQAYADARYQFSLNSGLVAALQASWRYQDKVFFLETNQGASDRSYFAKAWNSFDLRASIGGEQDRWLVALVWTNVGDERVATNVTPLGGFPNASFNEPSKLGVQLQFSY